MARQVSLRQARPHQGQSRREISLAFDLRDGQSEQNDLPCLPLKREVIHVGGGLQGGVDGRGSGYRFNSYTWLRSISSFG